MEQSAGGTPDVEKIVDSELFCQVCFDYATEGTYYRREMRLEFTCPQGHDNIVRDIRI